MSRTRKDRPFWVRSNDPKERRDSSHNHLRTHREKIGEEKFIRTPSHRVYDDDGSYLYTVPEYSWMVNIYRTWVEQADCNINEPVTHNEPRWRDGCRSWAVELGYGYKRDKQGVNQALRHNVRQQLNQIKNMDLDSIEEFDLRENPMYALSMWWD